MKTDTYVDRQILTLETRSFAALVAISLALLVLVGAIDYLTGFEMFFSVFYLLGVGFAAWFVGRTFGFVMSVLSVLVWLGGDLAAGAHYSRPWILAWNAVILTVIYFVVVMLLSHLRAAQRDLSLRVQQRTQALTREMAERERKAVHDIDPSSQAYTSTHAPNTNAIANASASGNDSPLASSSTLLPRPRRFATRSR